MKVLTVKTLEVISPETQRDIHYILRMEHQSDHIFHDKNADRYSATISMQNTDEAIVTIVDRSVEIPEYTIIVDDLDMENNLFQRLYIKKGKINKRMDGSLNWENQE